MNLEERRSAALLFAEELALGEVAADALERDAVATAVRDRAVPSGFSRRFQRRAMNRRSLSYETTSVAPMLAARRAVLGARAAGPPRLLVRVDGFPNERSARVHEMLRAYEVPYLAAVTPHVPEDSGWRYLSTKEIDLLLTLRDDDVVFGLTPHELPDEPAELTERLDRDEAAVSQHGVLPDVFVARGDRFTPAQYQQLAKRFAVVCGGDATVATMGWHPTPLWRGAGVYMPAYLSEDAGDIREAVQRLAAAEAAVWVPIVLPDAPDAELVSLCEAMRGLARPWDEFLSAVRASKVSAAP